MKFVVSGGAGFIGSHVVDGLIDSGFPILVVDDLSTGRIENINPNAVFKGPLDVSETPTEWLDQETTAIHFASQPKCNVSIYSPMSDLEYNYAVGVRFLTKCISGNIRRFVLISSMSVYGDQASSPYTEDMYPSPKDPYGIHKFALEQMCKTMCISNGIEYLILRPQHVFGVRQRYDLTYRNVIPRWIKKALLREPLPVFGSLSLTRAFSPISLVKRSIVAAATQSGISGEVFNLGSEHNRSLGDIAAAISSTLGVPVEYDFRPAPPTLLEVSIGATQKALEILGVRENTNEFEMNLRELARHMQICKLESDEIGIAPEVNPEMYSAIYENAE